LLVEEAQHGRLKLRMQVCFGFVHQEQRQISVVDFFEFDGDRRHVQ